MRPFLTSFFAALTVAAVSFPSQVSAQSFWEYAGNINPGIVQQQNVILHVLQGDPNLYATPTNSIYLSSNNGKNWRSYGVIEGATGMIRTKSSTVLAYGREQLFRTTDNGYNWSASAPTEEGNVITDMVQLSSGELFATMEMQGVRKSTDDGISWVSSMTGIPDGANCYLINALSNGDLLAVSSFYKTEVYRSSDTGRTWTKSDNGIEGRNIRAIVEDQVGNLYAAVPYDSLGGVYRSTDNGKTWLITKTGLGNEKEQVSALAVGQDNSIFASTIYTWEHPVIYRSFDGLTWHRTEGSPIMTTVYSLVVDNRGIVYVSDGVEIYRSVKTTSNVDKKTEKTSFIRAFYHRVDGALTVEGVVEGEELHLIDALGRTCRRFIVRNDVDRIGVSDLPSGYYVLYAPRASQSIGVLKN